NIDGGDLVEMHRGAVSLHVDGLKKAHLRSAGPQAAEIVFEGIDCAMHAALHFLTVVGGWLGHRCQSLVTIVARPFPLTTSRMAPGERMENTTTGIALSRASAMAAGSIILRSRVRISL